jgi:membrane protein
MNAVQKLQHNIDSTQQNQPFFGFVIGAWKKFGDDQAGYLAALVSYYAFASIFPLLLVMYTVLGLVLQNNVSLQHRLEANALHQYPMFSSYLPKGHTVGGAGIALVIGLVLTFYGARGVASAIQNALNTVWEVPFYRRPGFPKSLLRSFGLIIVIGVGQIVTITLSGYAGHASSFLPGPLGHIGAVAVSLLLNIGMFWLSFRLGTAKEITARDMRLGAIISGVFWTVLQFFGTYLVTHVTKSHNSAYGTFGVVLGLLAWFYLQAQITIYAVEFSVVRARRLWPRSMFPPPLTGADVHAYQMYASSQQRRPELVVEMRRTDVTDPAMTQPVTAAGEPLPRRRGSQGTDGKGADGKTADSSAANGAGPPQHDGTGKLGAAGQILSVVAVARALKRRRQRTG